MKKLMIALIILPLIITGCSKGDHPSPPPFQSANFTVTIENVGPVNAFVRSGVFNMPVGNTSPGAATPGKEFEFTINAGRSHSLSFATMLAATNDLFFGPDANGIALYDDDGNPISGDVTDQVYLWDAGTEVNEEPAVGPNTVTNQPAPNTGEDENGNVLKIEDVTSDTFDYPAVNEVIKVTVTHLSGTEFKVTIQDLSTAILHTSEGDKPAPLSPGAWVVYGGNENLLYTEGMPDLGQGIEGIAEDGDPTALGEYVATTTGVTYPASPGVWVINTHSKRPIFKEGKEDYGLGLEAIAEDGSATQLGSNITSLEGELTGDVMNTPAGSSSPGPILPGSKYEFSFEATKGENLSFATMLAATNDIFFGTEDKGIELFSPNGEPISGDITDMVYLWDAGTEVNDQPALGPNTVTNQLAPDTGIEENGPVQLLSKVNDGFEYPSVGSILKVTITSNQ